MLMEYYLEKYAQVFARTDRDIWNYEDGCVLIGLNALWEATGDEGYFAAMKAFIDRYIDEQGNIRLYRMEDYNLDFIPSGRVLFPLYEKTGREAYRQAAGALMEQLRRQPRTKAGSFWHKAIYPNQVWLDGLYMGLPFYALYQRRFGSGDLSDIVLQFTNARKTLYDEEARLYRHAYCETRDIFWCDRETGLSRCFWLRAVGWFSVALADLCEILPEEEAAPLRGVFAQLMSDLRPFADQETGLYYQLIDQPLTAGNYQETSGSSMIASAMLKGARLGVLPPDFRDLGRKTFEGIVRGHLSFSGGSLNLDSICLVAGLGPENNRRRDGSAAYYLSEPVVQNDAKGVAPLLLCYTEMKRLQP